MVTARLTVDELNQERCYFAIFGLPKPHPEHAKLIDVVRDASGGDFKQFIVPGGVGFVYKSKVLPWNLGFGKVLLNGDTRFITEISQVHYQEGYGAAVRAC